MLTARDIMTTKVVSVSPETSLKDLAELFVSSRYSNIPVLEAGRLVGMVSETDLIEQQKPLHIPTVMAIFDGVFYLDSEKRFQQQVDRVTAQTVGEICQKEPVSCGPATSLSEIAKLMSKHKAHLIPVLEKGRLLGVVARLDLIKAFRE